MKHTHWQRYVQDASHDKKATTLVALCAFLVHATALYILFTSEHAPLSLAQLLIARDNDTDHVSTDTWVATHAHRPSVALVYRAPTHGASHNSPSDHPPAPQGQTMQAAPPDETEPQHKQSSPEPREKSAQREQQRADQKTVTAHAQEKSPSFAQVPSTKNPAQQPKPYPDTASPQPTVHAPQQPPTRSMITLAQLAQEFMEEAKRDQVFVMNSKQSPAAMNMKGKAGDGHPSEEQLRIGRYAHRILKALVEAYHRNRRNVPQLPPFQDYPDPIVVHITIDRAGSLVSFNLLKSSGVGALDLFVETIFKDASSAFPPIPKVFRHGFFPFQMTIHNVHTLSSTEYWQLG